MKGSDAELLLTFLLVGLRIVHGCFLSRLSALSWQQSFRKSRIAAFAWEFCKYSP